MFSGIFSGVVFSKPKIKVLSFAEQGTACRAAAKIYIALLHANLFFKDIRFYNELLKLAYPDPNKKCNKNEEEKVCKIAIDFF